MMKKILFVCGVVLPLFFLTGCGASKKAGSGPAGEISADIRQMLDSVGTTAEIMPTFQGGGPIEFRRWVQSHLTYPEHVFKEYVEGITHAVDGRVMAEFVVETDGSVKLVNILSSPGAEFSRIVRNIILRSPKWMPGVKKDELVRVRFTIPVDFRLTPGTKSRLDRQREQYRTSRLNRQNSW